jgi:capsule polysaccharide modification protein KpsS
MKVLIILDYFRYFISFSGLTDTHEYLYTTIRRKLLKENVNDLIFCDLKKYDKIKDSNPKGDWENYFKLALKLNSVKKNVDIKRLSIIFENFFENIILKNKIDILIGGGTTGFERCGLAAARRLGIKTLCVWEGFFRPNTMSVDPLGMNAESSFHKKSFQQIVDYTPSGQFNLFFKNYVDSIKNIHLSKIRLKDIHGIRFNILHQLKNRWNDRKDLERIRLPITQHLSSRIAYYSFKIRYLMANEITEPFIFLPLQTHTDSNVIINGEIFPFDRYVKIISEAFLRAKDKIKCKLIIKEHPFDVFRKKYNKNISDDILWLSPETPVSEILTNQFCVGTIVINSTAGLESLIYGKPVIALAKSVYAYPELTLHPEVINLENVIDLIEKLPNQKVNQELIYKFAGCLFDNMQIEGNIDIVPSNKDVINFENYLLNKYKMNLL